MPSTVSGHTLIFIALSTLADELKRDHRHPGHRFQNGQLRMDNGELNTRAFAAFHFPLSIVNSPF